MSFELLAADAAPGDWQRELELGDADARMLADAMSTWPGVGIYAYARQLCPYSAATILLKHEIAWTELEDSRSLVALDWQAKRRRVLPPLVAHS
jgi:hypothetical protein